MRVYVVSSTDGRRITAVARGASRAIRHYELEFKYKRYRPYPASVWVSRLGSRMTRKDRDRKNS